MIKASEFAGFYETKPAVRDELVTHENTFTRLIEATRDTAVGAYDTLAYLAGIKAGSPLDNRYDNLDTSSLQALLESAKQAGFNAQVLQI